MLRRCLLSLLLLLPTGCQLGSFSASIDSDTLIPRLSMSAVPEQFEPLVTDTDADSAAE